MQTQYGKLPIVVDPTTGRAKMVRGSVDGHATGTKSAPSTRRYLDKPKGEASLTVAGAGSSPASSPIDAYDSKLEAARATYLGYLMLAGDIKRVIHHPFTTDLAVELEYTPDFMIWWKDGRIQVEEVKGHLKQKNARDSMSRLKMAASKFPMFEWFLTMRIRGQWEERPIS